MRIAITADYLDPDDIGGAGRVIVEIARGLVDRGHEVAVLAGGPRAEEGIRTLAGRTVHWISHRYDTGSSRGLGTFLIARRRIRRAWARLPFRPDRVLHHQPLTAHAIGAISAPVTYYFHSPWSHEYRAEHLPPSSESATEGAASLGRARTRLQVEARRRIEGSVLRRADRVVCLSEWMRTTLLETHTIDRSRTEVHPGGVDLQRFRPLDRAHRREVRTRYGASPEGLLICSVRRMVPRTGLDLLLRAIAHAAAPLGDFRLVIPGQGPQRDSLTSLASELGISDRVEFPGYLPDDDLPLLYGASELSVVPTRALEGFGLSTLESLACGTPVVATPVGGSVEILRGLDPELIAERVDPSALAARLVHWAKMGDRRRSVAGECRTYVSQHFGWDRLTEAALLPTPPPARPDMSVAETA